MTIQGTQVLMYTKNILFLCFSDFSIFLFKHIMHGHIREKKEIPNYVKLKHHNFVMSKHTDVLHDWRALVVRWLFMHFS